MLQCDTAHAQKPIAGKNTALLLRFYSQRCALERHVSPSGPLPQYGFGQDLQWYATDAIVGHKLDFRRHPPLEQARLPGLSSHHFQLGFGKRVVPKSVGQLKYLSSTEKRRLCILCKSTWYNSSIR